jgi:hypothetical protein
MYICTISSPARFYPQPGWVEHDPREIAGSQMDVAAEAGAKVDQPPARKFDSGPVSPSKVSRKMKIPILYPYPFPILNAKPAI